MIVVELKIKDILHILAALFLFELSYCQADRESKDKDKIDFRLHEIQSVLVVQFDEVVLDS